MLQIMGRKRINEGIQKFGLEYEGEGSLKELKFDLNIAQGCIFKPGILCVRESGKCNVFGEILNRGFPSCKPFFLSLLLSESNHYFENIPLQATKSPIENKHKKQS